MAVTVAGVGPVASPGPAQHADPTPSPRVLVAALGDTAHGDEGFGAHVLRALPAGDLAPRTHVEYYGTDSERLLADLRDGWDALVLLDALPERGCPGALRVVDLDARRTVTVRHDLDAETRDPGPLVSAVKRLVPRTVLVGCEVVDADERLGLTGDVEACVRPAARFVLSVLERLTGRRSPALPDEMRPEHVLRQGSRTG
ncbi:hydrogenase maturation protease [Aquipuribacter nitratireducens]|uniref:Hydrogenase maturation protease n=1 Tax=Aquipuribacter nitratireducens TaxID=650104 RepID=A0ABW0GJY3_9MICO